MRISHRDVEVIQFFKPKVGQDGNNIATLNATVPAKSTIVKVVDLQTILRFNNLHKHEITFGGLAVNLC